MNMDQMKTKFEAYLLTERRVAGNTISSYTRDLEQLALYMTKHALDLNSITGDNLKSFVHYLHGLKLNARTISRKISSIKAFFAYLHTYFNIKNSSQELCFPKIDKKLPVYLSQEEVRSILEQAEKDTSALGGRTTIMLYLLYVSGMRVSELIHLRITDFHFDTGFISIMGKGGKQRLIPLPQMIVTLVHNYFKELKTSHKGIANKESLYIFPVVYGKLIKPISRQSCWMIVQKLCKKAGINRPVSPHQLRHSFATHMLSNGADLRSLQMLLGHESIGTVQIYTHVETSQLRKIYDKKHPRS